MSRLAFHWFKARSSVRALTVFGALALAPAACLTTSAQAQDSLLAEIYGQGVHAYNSRQYQTAVNSLTTAITSGSRDPRAYYFRGLSYARMGYGDQAGIDFQSGADLEARNQGDAFYPVSQSLQRIQGADRLVLEAYRNVARLRVRQEEMARNRERYEQLEKARGTVARPDAAAAPGTNPADLPPPPANAKDPFSGDAGANLGAGTPADAPPRAPTGAAPAAEEPVFGAEPATGTPENIDPFGDADPDAPPATPMPMPMTETPPAAGDDPFADDPMPAAEGAAPAEPAAEEPAAEPAGEAPAEDDDPFN